MNIELEKKLLNNAILSEEDLKILKQSSNLINFLFDCRLDRIKKIDKLSDYKKMFVIRDEKLYCIDVKLDDENLSFEAKSKLYEITPSLLGGSFDKLEVNFIGEALNLTIDKEVSISIFKAEQSQDGILTNILSSNHLIDRKDITDEYDLPRKRYLHFEDYEKEIQKGSK